MFFFFFFEGMERDLTEHCLMHMAGKPELREISRNRGLCIKGNSNKAQIVKKILETGLSYQELTRCFRTMHKKPNVERMISDLKSGLLKGHSWHGARPSTMHMQLQTLVRKCIAGEFSLESLIQMGADIAKQEYFMDIQHDIIAEAIICHCEDSVPEIGKKSLSDFVLNGVPFDLKVSTHTEKWQQYAGKMTDAQKREFAEDYFRGADKERMRKQADKAKYTWGLNRLYVLVRDQDRWFSEPRVMIDALLVQIDRNEKPFRVKVDGLELDCLVYEI